MRLLQANIWGGRLDKLIPTFLNKESTDIACLQEVLSTEGDAALAITLEEITAATDLKHGFYSPGLSFDLMNKPAHFGNAILSQYPFASHEIMFTNLAYNPSFKFGTDDYNIRNLQHAVIEFEGVQLNVLNHHGHHIRTHKNGDAETLRQMEQIAAYIDQLSGPVILAGDFNLAPKSESLQVLNERLTNLSIEHKLSTTRTALTVKTEVCDYIFVNDLVHVNSFTASDEIISDHKALVLDFSL